MKMVIEYSPSCFYTLDLEKLHATEDGLMKQMLTAFSCRKKMSNNLYRFYHLVLYT